MGFEMLPLTDVPIGSIINCIKIKVPKDVLEIVPGMHPGTDSTKCAIFMCWEHDFLLIPSSRIFTGKK